MASKLAQEYLPGDSVFKYSIILQSLTQSGTSAPTGTTRKNETAATLTLGRNSAGVYTITASSGVFTAGKTDVILPAPGNGLHVYDVDFTSNTVITITTGVLTNLIGLITAVPTDGILDGRTFEIRIHD